MNNQEIFAFMGKNPGFFLATVEEDLPRVRGMFLYSADESGIVFHTGAFKDVCKQILQNPNVQLCFYSPEDGIQIRVRGTLQSIDDNALKEEISEHPSRFFLKPWKSSVSAEEFYKNFYVFRMSDGIANVWTMQTNWEQKTDIALF